MKHQTQPTTQEVLAGVVERVTYHNEESGFCVLRIKARGHRELVTVVGHGAVISAGEWITASGAHGRFRTSPQAVRTSRSAPADSVLLARRSGQRSGLPVQARLRS